MNIVAGIMTALFLIGIYIVFEAMVGYTISLKILYKLFGKNKSLGKTQDYKTVTVMIVAHNEEKVILEKLENVLQLDYPKDKITYMVASDNCTDRTDEMVEEFIQLHQDSSFIHYKTKEHFGKTNAQNEAQKLVKSDILVMTDANAMLDPNAVKELVSSFSDETIAYVTGRLQIINNQQNDVAGMENTYWDMDLKMRQMESELGSVTAGNGAIYACRNADYYDFRPIECHDLSMPRYFVVRGRRAIFNPDAVAYEKAGEVIEDEFKRKVRMNREILHNIFPDYKLFNVFQNGWFSYFYFGHRTCRYLLWFAHLLILATNLLLIFAHPIWWIPFIGQLAFYFVALIGMITKTKNKLISMPYYYCMTVFAQWVGVFKMIMNQSKATWDKAETTR